MQINAPGRLIRKKNLTTETTLNFVLAFILAKYNYFSCLSNKTTTDVEHSPNSHLICFLKKHDKMNQNHHISVGKTETSTYPTPLPKKPRVALIN